MTSLSGTIRSHKEAIERAKKYFETRECEYTEIIKLAEALEERKIGFSFSVFPQGFQLEVYRIPYNQRLSVIERDGSYGCKNDMLEVWSPTDREPSGPMTAYGAELMIDKFLGIERVMN